jgi:perosamine synthetase
MAGFNYRLTDFQAALGREQLKRLPSFLETRRILAAEYERIFAATPIVAQKGPEGATPNYQAFIVRLPDGVDRDEVIKKLLSLGIGAGIATWHIPLTRYYRNRYGYKPGDFPVTDAVFKSGLALPLHQEVKLEDIEFIAKELIKMV